MLAWTSAFFVLFCGAIVGHTAFRYRRILKVTGYFLKASIAYVITGDEGAKLAALAASERIDGKERLTRTEFLKSVESSLIDKKDKRLRTQIERCQKLLKAFNQMDSEKRALSLRDNLAIKNRPYYAALIVGDQQVFARRHAGLARAAEPGADVVAESEVPYSLHDESAAPEPLLADLTSRPGALQWSTSQTYADAAHSALLRHTEPVAIDARPTGGDRTDDERDAEQANAEPTPDPTSPAEAPRTVPSPD